MKYEAHVTGREGRWWAIEIPTLGQDTQTQAKRLEEVAEEARDYIAVTLDVPPSSVEVEVIVDDIGGVQDIQDRSQRIIASRKLIEMLERQVQVDTQELAVELSGEGVPMRDISALVGTTFQRVGQLVNSPLVDAVIPAETETEAIRAWARRSGVTGPATDLVSTLAASLRTTSHSDVPRRKRPTAQTATVRRGRQAGIR